MLQMEEKPRFFVFCWGYDGAVYGILRKQTEKRGTEAMKKITGGLLAVLLLVTMLPVRALGAEYLIPVGQVVGLELADDTVTVAAFDEELGAQTRQAGLCVGDRIMDIDGRPVHCAEDVRLALHCSKGLVAVRVQRQGKEELLRLSPAITAEGPKLGVFLKQGVTGIGTVTYYDPQSGEFAALGHGVNTPEGQLVQMRDGKAYKARVMAVTKGQVGKPGQLQGAVTAREVVGALRDNTPQGVFGKATQGWPGQTVEVGSAADVRPGQATIRSTVEGNTVREYSVEILKIYPKGRSSGRNMMIRITDPALLQATGGIVQGMSGSPIIQDGKLVGAVTHVLVNDPTTGYGIFIENMLDAAA